MYLENQSITTLQDIIDDIITFAVANAGFTDEGTLAGDTITNAITNFRRISKDGMYLYFYGVSENYTSPTRTEGAIYFKMMRVLPDLSNYLLTTIDGQRRQTKTSVWQVPNGPFTGLNLYSNNLTGNNDGTYVSAVIEIQPNVFTHLTFGKIDKFGIWTGGEITIGNQQSYFSTTYSPSYSYSDFFMSSQTLCYVGYTNDSVTNGYLYRPTEPAQNDVIDYSPLGTSGYLLSLPEALFALPMGMPTSVNNNLFYPLFNNSPNAVNLRSMLFPTYLLMPTYSLGTDRHVAGHMSGIKLLNIENLQPKDLVDLYWRVYPVVAKTGDGLGNPVTDNNGIAYKRIS